MSDDSSAAAKARKALDAAAAIEAEHGGLRGSDLQQVTVLFSIAQTSAMVSIAESLERLADKHAPKPVEKSKPAAGQYL